MFVNIYKFHHPSIINPQRPSPSSAPPLTRYAWLCALLIHDSLAGDLGYKSYPPLPEVHSLTYLHLLLEMEGWLLTSCAAMLLPTAH